MKTLNLKLKLKNEHYNKLIACVKEYKDGKTATKEDLFNDNTLIALYSLICGVLNNTK